MFAHLIKSPEIQPKSGCFSRFQKQEEGSATIFSCFLIFMMIFVGGIAIDLMNNEMERVERQHTLDAAVLAASNLNQQLPPDQVLEDYVQKSGFGGELKNVSIVSTEGFRSVSADLDVDTINTYMNYLGRDTLPVRASSAAQQVLQGLEISLILDVSSSMASNGRIQSLRPAAKSFVDIILSGELEDVASINLVPYGGSVNIGDFMFDRLGGTRWSSLDIATQESIDNGAVRVSDDNSCLDLGVSDLTDTEFPDAGSYMEIPKFSYWTFENWWCPKPTSRVQYGSNDADELKDVIDAMELSDGTGTQFAMQYGLSLLDPSSRDDFAALHANGELGSDYTNRPLPYGTGKKYVVLMTDGGVAREIRPEDPYNPNLLTTRMNRTSALRNQTEVTRNSNNTRADFSRVCDDAKASGNGVVIFTIAMESSTAEDLMRDCASSPAHFYKVTGNNIESAFVAIAHTVGREALRLLH